MSFRFASVTIHKADEANSGNAWAAIMNSCTTYKGNVNYKGNSLKKGHLSDSVSHSFSSPHSQIMVDGVTNEDLVN